MPRPRRKWTHYPSSFIKILEHFHNSKETLRIPVPRTQLYVYRTQFYRFMNAIRDEHDNIDERIAAACGLTDAFNIANSMLIRTEEETSELIFEWGVLADDFAPTTIEQFEQAKKSLRVAQFEPKPDKQMADLVASLTPEEEDKDLYRPDGTPKTYEELFGKKENSNG